MTENVRLLIWDLDETFWKGTLTEGGVQFLDGRRELIIELTRRGIINTICSKNFIEPVQELLEKAGVWDYFVLPSVDWTPKGPRVAALIEQLQLRPATVLFIDDNESNLREAEYYAPGLRTARPDVIGKLLDDPRLVGKDDSDFSRLKQYKALEKRAQEMTASAVNVEDFLRSSQIRVEIDHDVRSHLDRAIELINRTNQLNFIKKRLPDDVEQARQELSALLDRHDIQAGLLSVRDIYGDHGYAGLYILRSGVELLQFCFSCRILGMGVETWLYNRLDRPRLYFSGAVLSNPVADRRKIDWVDLAPPSLNPDQRTSRPRLERKVIARGGCDLQAITHYLGFAAQSLTGEFNVGRNGFDARKDHSIFLRHALRGLSPAALAAATRLGYASADFTSALFAPEQQPTAWLLSFWSDAAYALYQHRHSELCVPFALPGQANHMEDVTRLPESALPPQFEKHRIGDAFRFLRSEFDYFGGISEADYKTNLALVLDARRGDVPVVILGANETLRDPHAPNVTHRSSASINLNRWTGEVLEGRKRVVALPVRACVTKEAEVRDWGHFDRMVYYRLHEKIVQLLAG